MANLQNINVDDDDGELKLADVWNSNTCKMKHKCPESYQTQFFMKAVNLTQNREMLISLVNSIRGGEVAMKNDKALASYKEAFPLPFAQNFQFCIFGSKTNQVGLWQTYPFDVIRDGECQFGELTIEDLDCHLSEGVILKGGYIVSEKADPIQVKALDCARLFAIGHRVLKGGSAPIWGVTKSLPLDNALGIDLTLGGDSMDSVRAMISPPDNAKVPAITYMYDKIMKSDVPERSRLTKAIIVKHYGKYLKMSTKPVLLKSDKKTGIYFVEIATFKFKRPRISVDATDADVQEYLTRDHGLPDPFGCFWYMGVALGKIHKQIYESVVFLHNIIEGIEGSALCIMNSSRVDAIALSAIPVKDKEYVFVGGSLQDREFKSTKKARVINIGNRHGIDSAVDFSILGFPTNIGAVVMKKEELLRTFVDDELKKKHKTMETYGFKHYCFRADWRYYKYYQGLMTTDVDPSNGLIWVYKGKIGKEQEAPVRTLVVAGVSSRVDNIALGVKYKGLMRKCFLHGKVKFVYADKQEVRSLGAEDDVSKIYDGDEQDAAVDTAVDDFKTESESEDSNDGDAVEQKEVIEEIKGGNEQAKAKILAKKEEEPVKGNQPKVKKGKVVPEKEKYSIKKNQNNSSTPKESSKKGVSGGFFEGDSSED